MLHVGRTQCRLPCRLALLRNPTAFSPTPLSILRTSTYSQHTTSKKQFSRITSPVNVHGKTLLPAAAVNPPVSALPPPLELPLRDPAAPVYKYLFNLGRAYARFYKTGFKQIFHNVKLSRELPVGPFTPKARKHEALNDGTITRGQYHLLLRVRSDISRLPLFALVFILCGEFTPLFVPFLGPVVPKTLWLPSQWEKARQKASERRERSKARRKEGKTAGLLEPQYKVGSKLRAWPRWLEAMSVGGVFSPLLLKRLEKRLGELRIDDSAIQRNGGIDALSDEELRLAGDVRGVDVLGKEISVLRRKLEKRMLKHEKVWASFEEGRRR